MEFKHFEVEIKSFSIDLILLVENQHPKMAGNTTKTTFAYDGSHPLLLYLQQVTLGSNWPVSNEKRADRIQGNIKLKKQSSIKIKRIWKQRPQTKLNKSIL